jgi:GMP synthase (glutamine-hydrolysing)
VRVLSVTHGTSVPGGVFEDAVEAAGHALERWSVPLGGTPGPASSYDAVMVFGGSMHPDSDEELHWLGLEEEFLRSVLADDVPAIGVCLGAQMLARAAGAWVAPAPSPEIGWFEVGLTPEGRQDPVLRAIPARTTAFQWHSYTFGIPPRGTELARSAVCTQAFRVGSAWGIQFHAEVTLAMVEAWVAEEDDELPVPAEEFLGETASRIAAWNEQGRALCSAFLKVAASGRRRREKGATRTTTSLAADT